MFFVFNLLSKEACNKKEDEFPDTPRHIPIWFYYVFVFFTGAVIIASEVIFVRVLNLTIGSTVYNFPLVLSIYILSLALGSLSIAHKKSQRLHLNSLTLNLSLSILFFLFAYLSAPYWSVWFSNMRVSLQSIPTNYPIFLFLSFLYLFVFLFPPCFFMGRLLPLAYALCPKDRSNYGRVCGNLYFSNTLGSVFGSVFLAHIFLHFANLDHILKYSLFALFLLLLGLFLLSFEKKKRLLLLSFGSLFALGLLFLPLWNRAGHYVGYFRMSSPKKKYHFQDNIFTLKERVDKNRKIDFFKDGPNTTVTVLGYSSSTNTNPLLKKIFGKKSHSLFVNGKSDGNTLGDFLPTYYLPILPYLYIAKEGPLDAAVIGLGTGTTAGILGKSRDIREVSVLEISPKVIEGIRKEKYYPLNPLFMKKTKVIQTDAFKFFTRSQKKYDIIVAEPSNPWVVGVENLYTIDFYDMVLASLSEEGIFSQWMHIYSANREMLHTVFDSMRRSFPLSESLHYGNR